MSSGSRRSVIGIPQLRPRWTRAQIASAIPVTNMTAPITPSTGLWTARLPVRNTRTMRNTASALRPPTGVHRRPGRDSLARTADASQ